MARFHPDPAVPFATAMAVQGHEDQFRPPRRNGRCRLGDATFARRGGEEEDAPNSAVGLEAMRYDRSEFDGLLTSFPLNGDL